MGHQIKSHRGLVKTMINELVIVQHPVSVCVPCNYKVTLSVRAVGKGALQYQWFQSESDKVPGGTECDLVVTAQRKQYFVCRVNDLQQNCVFSEWVKVKVLDVAEPGLPEPWHGEPRIAVQPQSQVMCTMGRVSLQCAAFGMPAPQYQWYKNGTPIDGATGEILQIENVSQKDCGSYLCAVTNVLGEQWTEAADITTLIPESPPVKKLTATDKVALLMGNLNYRHHPGLLAPMLDVQELSSHLQTLGFRVLSLLDLTRVEMLAATELFLQLLDTGVYALFYYAGHGYECSGRNYLVPVDAPQPYRPENCVSVQRVMRGMQERHTALNVVLLDTCRKWYNQHCPASEIRALAPLGNTVYGYATCEDAEAFEVQDGGRSNGVFTKYLNKRVLQSEKITWVLEQVSEDLGADLLVKGKQVVEIRHTLKDPRALTDPIHSTGHTAELRLRDVCWRQANELPGRRLLAFPCGTEVELTFSALFSNVLVIFATLKTKGPEALDISISLSSSPVLEDVFSNVSWTNEVDSLLLSRCNNPDCTLRLCGLQKLQRALVLMVELHYTHAALQRRLTESRQLEVGLPLVAACNLQHKRPVEGATAMVGSLSVENRERPDRAQWGPCYRPSTRKAETAWQLHGETPNEPEENDESDLLQFAL